MRGGQGNGKLLSWDYNRTANLTMNDALLSDVSLGLLAGSEVQKDNIVAVGREVLTVATDAIALAETPKAGTILSVYKTSGGVITDEVPSASYTAVGKDIEFTAGVVDGEVLMVFYEYDVTSPDATKVTFSGKKFPSTYRVVGETFVREQSTGLDRKMQFHIAKAKLQSTFSLTMDVENASTFDFNLEILVDGFEQDLYDLIRL